LLPGFFFAICTDLEKQAPGYNPAPRCSFATNGLQATGDSFLLHQVSAKGDRGDMPQVYRYNFTVPQEAEDMNGHVNNVEYLRWMQDAAMLHSAAQGSTAATKSAGATWVVRTHKIEYFRPAFAGEQITILTWVANVRRVQSLRKYKVVRPADKALLAEGATNWVFVDAASGKLRSIPREIQSLFEVLPEDKDDEIVCGYI